MQLLIESVYAVYVSTIDSMSLTNHRKHTFYNSVYVHEDSLKIQCDIERSIISIEFYMIHNMYV